MTIRWIGQSGYILKTGQTKIAIDPYLSDSVNRVAGRPRLRPIPVKPEALACDGVICTHNHLDHLDPDTVCAMPREQFFITTKEGKEALARLGRENAAALAEGERIKIGDCSITAVYANHTVEAFGIILQAEGKTVYFSGDTLFDEKLFEISRFKPDMTLICINGKLGNMNVEEALITAKNIGAKINVPNHYDMFASNSEDPLRFTEHIAGGYAMEFDGEFEL